MKSQNLDDNKQVILKEFIKEFLPERGSKRKSSGNEIDYIHTSLNRVFKQNFGFNLSGQHIFDAFKDLNYTFLKPLKKENSITFINGYPRETVHIDIEPSIIRKLMLTSMKPLKKMSQEKITIRADMKKKIELFKQANQS